MRLCLTFLITMSKLLSMEWRLTALHLKGWPCSAGYASADVDFTLQGCSIWRRNWHWRAAWIKATPLNKGVRSGVTRLRRHEDSEMQALSFAGMWLHACRAMPGFYIAYLGSSQGHVCSTGTQHLSTCFCSVTGCSAEFQYASCCS